MFSATSGGIIDTSVDAYFIHYWRIMYIYIYFVYLCNMYHMLFCVLFGQTKNGLNAVLSLNHRSNLCVIFVLFRLKYHAI